MQQKSKLDRVLYPEGGLKKNASENGYTTASIAQGPRYVSMPIYRAVPSRVRKGGCVYVPSSDAWGRADQV